MVADAGILPYGAGPTTQLTDSGLVTYLGAAGAATGAAVRQELATAEDRVLCAEALFSSAHEPTRPGELAQGFAHLVHGNIREDQMFAICRSGVMAGGATTM